MTAPLSKRARVLLVLALTVPIWLWGSGEVQGMKDRQKVAQMTEKMKTVCVGRFLIDLPANAEFERNGTRIDGFRVISREEQAEAFIDRVAAREAQIATEPNSLRRKNLESATIVDTNGFHGKIFVFGRTAGYTMEFGKRHEFENVAVEGYVHAKGTSFDFIADAYDPDWIGALAKLIGRLRLVGAGEIPSAAGFCVEQGIILDPLTAEQGEASTIFVALPGHPDLSIAFSTRAGIKARWGGLLARNTKSAEREPAWVRAAFTTLREGKRTINGLPGEELALRVRELNFSTVFGLDWEVLGKPDDVFEPAMHLELETGRNPQTGGKPVQSSLTEDGVLALWDKISSSIRIRPTSAPSVTHGAPPLSPLGTIASAGDTCPQTGWWLCREGGDGVGVLGGQRQFIRKGQRMPQALLLPRQTVWEKLRGLQPSYESSKPTAWKLVDKRASQRGQPPVALAPAAVPPSADALAAKRRVPAPSAVPLGSHVTTGAPCPASGWWRCEEPNALDGTRWFAEGSLLPVATFKIPSGGFGNSQRSPKVIQRRSGWQLVRYALAPEEQAAAAASKPQAGQPATKDTAEKLPPRSDS